MKAILSIVVDVLWKFVVKYVDESIIEDLIRQSVTRWCEKHLTAEEIGSELKDLVKLLKEKL